MKNQRLQRDEAELEEKRRKNRKGGKEADGKADPG